MHLSVVVPWGNQSRTVDRVEKTSLVRGGLLFSRLPAPAEVTSKHFRH